MRVGRRGNLTQKEVPWLGMGAVADCEHVLHYSQTLIIKAGWMDGWIDDSCHKLDYRLVYTGAVEMLPFFLPLSVFVCLLLCFIPLLWIQDISQMSGIAVYHLLSFCSSQCSPDPLHILGENTLQSEKTVTMAYPAKLVKCPLWCFSSGQNMIKCHLRCFASGEM